MYPLVPRDVKWVAWGLIVLLSGCSKRAPSSTEQSALPIASVSKEKSAGEVPKRSKERADGCPRLDPTPAPEGLQDTPWSKGGLIRGLDAEALVEPDVRNNDGGPSNWQLNEPPIEVDLPDAHIALVSLRAPLGGAVVSLRKVESGFCVVGVWGEQSGAAGAWAEHLGHEKSLDGRALVAVYQWTTGMQMNGQNTYECSLIHFLANRESLEQQAGSEVDCVPPTEPVKFVRTKKELTARTGSKSWVVDDLE